MLLNAISSLLMLLALGLVATPIWLALLRYSLPRIGLLTLSLRVDKVRLSKHPRCEVTAMRRQAIVVGSLSMMYAMFFVSRLPNLKGGIVSAQVDGKPLESWVYPNAQGGPVSSSSWFTTGTYWTEDDFDLVVQHYAVRAGYVINDAHPHVAEFIRKTRTGVMGGGDKQLLIDRRDDVRTAVVVRREEGRTSSVFISRSDKDERTRILVTTEERTARKLVAVSPADRVRELLKDRANWMFPGAQFSGASAGDGYRALEFTTAESLKAVCDFYAGLSGAELPARFLDPPTQTMGGKDFAVVSNRRSQVHTVTLSKHLGGDTILAIASRATAEERTNLRLVILREATDTARLLEEEALEEWIPNGGKRIAATVDEKLRTASYVTQESYLSVLEAYAMKVGFNHADRLIAGSGSVGFGKGVILYTNRPDVQDLTLVYRTDRSRIILVLSRGVNEGETHVTLMGEAR